MFGRHKMYKKGMADAMGAYEAFSQKQEAALSRMREEIRQGNESIESELNKVISQLVASGNSINGIYDYLDSKEKSALLHLNPPVDIRTLDPQYKQFLLAVLFQLADNMHTMTTLQKKYLRSVMKCLEIINPQTSANLPDVGEIDSLEVQKAIYQAALEFFYLQDSADFTEAQEEFLGYFSVNKKQAALIEEYVSHFYNLMGADGIAEKYGDVSEAETEFLSRYMLPHFDNPLDEYYYGAKLFFEGNINAERVLKSARNKGIPATNTPLYWITGDKSYLREGYQAKDYLSALMYADECCTDEECKKEIFDSYMGYAHARFGTNPFVSYFIAKHYFYFCEDFSDRLEGFLYLLALAERGFILAQKELISLLNIPADISDYTQNKKDQEAATSITLANIYNFVCTLDNNHCKEITKITAGVLNEIGIGFSQNYDIAMIYYEDAANDGFLTAYYYLGRCYMEGIGVKSNKERALYLFDKACDDDYNTIFLALHMMAILKGDYTVEYEYYL